MQAKSIDDETANAPSSVDELEEALSRPSQPLITMFADLRGDIAFLGVGGKMGPTMARMAKRATDASGVSRRIIGISRFSSPALRDQLNAWGIETISCNLLHEEEMLGLPDTPNIICMSGFKFGTGSNPAMSWAMNCYVPSVICRRFRRSRLSAFSSGNVYGLVPTAGGGSRETDSPRPVGEYAMAVLGRERMYEYFSRELGIPTCILRLNYATELRYGVLVDLALKVFNGEPVDVSTGYVNVIWQRDANEMALRSLVHGTVPPRIFNIAGSEILVVRDIAETLGQLLDRPVHFVGTEAPDALLNNAIASYPMIGEPKTPMETVLRWTAEWMKRGGELLGKPTHFESRDGVF